MNTPVPDICALYKRTVDVEADDLPPRPPVDLSEAIMSVEVTIGTTHSATWATKLGEVKGGRYSSSMPEVAVAALGLPSFDDSHDLFFPFDLPRGVSMYARVFITVTVAGIQITVRAGSAQRPSSFCLTALHTG